MRRKNDNTNIRLNAGAIIFALILLCNPNIAFIDLLPDFIAYFVLMRSLRHATKRVPYFDEARSGFFKLAILSLARFPALLLMALVRSANTSDSDIITLFSLVFAVLEAIFAFGCINSLFAGIAHIGTRTGKASIIGEAPSSDSLRSLTIVFTAVKCLTSAAPEFARLTSTDSIGTFTTSLERLSYYPILFVISEALGYVFGFVFVAYFARYIKRIAASGEYPLAIMELTTPEREAEIAYDEKLRGARIGLGLLVPAAFLSFDFMLDQANSINILPHFISIVLLLIALFKLSSARSGIYLATKLAGFVSLGVSVGAWIVSIVFHKDHSFADIMLHAETEELYRYVIIAFAAELAAVAVFLVLFALSLIRFIKTHTGKTPFGITDPFRPDEEKEYTAYDRRYHRSLITRAWIFSAIGIVGAIAKFLTVLSNAKREFAAGARIPAIIPSVAPWLGAAVLAVSVIWGLYTYMLSGTLKEDYSIKYAREKFNPEKSDE